LEPKNVSEENACQLMKKSFGVLKRVGADDSV